MEVGGKEEEGQARVNLEELVVRGVMREKTGDSNTGGPAYTMREERQL